MGEMDKIKNDAEKATGKVKEKVGDWTDNESLEAEGRSDQAKADLKNAGEKVKDAARDTKDALTD
jgi:uncharacterized protein YjbJ (UPF0337 family)